MRELDKAPHEQEALFGGTGTVALWDLLGRVSAPPFSAALSCELEAGGSVGKHVQQRDPEIIIGLGGDGEAEVDDALHPLVAGSLVYLAHGQTLSIHNRSKDEPLRYLIIKAQVIDTQNA
ncbi:MAG: cupin domain-containing protein [Polyangiales bacterium]